MTRERHPLDQRRCRSRLPGSVFLPHERHRSLTRNAFVLLGHRHGMHIIVRESFLLPDVHPDFFAAGHYADADMPDLAKRSRVFGPEIRRVTSVQRVCADSSPAMAVRRVTVDRFHDLVQVMRTVETSVPSLEKVRAGRSFMCPPTLIAARRSL